LAYVPDTKDCYFKSSDDGSLPYDSAVSGSVDFSFLNCLRSDEYFFSDI
jgi:hypothetical protein